MPDISDQTSKESFDEFCKLAKSALGTSEKLAEQMLDEMKSAYQRISEATDVNKIAATEIEKSVKECINELRLAKINGGISEIEFNKYTAKLNEFKDFDDISDASAKIGVVNKLKDYTKQRNEMYEKTHDLKKYGKINQRFDMYTKIPDAIKDARVMQANKNRFGKSFDAVMMDAIKRAEQANKDIKNKARESLIRQVGKEVNPFERVR